MPDCIFCKISSGESAAHKIYENDKVVVFLDILPVNEGHALFVPKAHSKDILEASPEDIEAVMKAIKELSPGILKALGADGFNLGLNTGASAGQVVFHTHFHFMPRKTGVPRTFDHVQVSQEELAATAERIKAVL